LSWARASACRRRAASRSLASSDASRMRRFCCSSCALVARYSERQRWQAASKRAAARAARCRARCRRRRWGRPSPRSPGRARRARGVRGRAVDGVVELAGELGHHRERRRIARDIEHVAQRGLEVSAGHRQPDRVDVRAQQVLVLEVDARRDDRAGDHLARAAEEVLVVRAAGRAVRQDERGLAAATGAAAALRVVGRRRRDVAQVDRRSASRCRRRAPWSASRTGPAGGRRGTCPRGPRARGSGPGRCARARGAGAARRRRCGRTPGRTGWRGGRPRGGRDPDRVVEGGRAGAGAPHQRRGGDLVAGDGGGGARRVGEDQDAGDGEQAQQVADDRARRRRW
jgi:hypothetical protein